MRFGAVIPFGDARYFVRCARLAEQSGWDAVFGWEALFGLDPWVAMGAAAMETERIRLGTLLTPVSRVRPWDLASRVTTLDRLSGGRVILGAGLGALHDGWTAYEPDDGRPARVERLEECLAIYAGLLTGGQFTFEGKHYQVRPHSFPTPDPPVQQPYPPVWLVGAYRTGRRRQPSLDRAAGWQGLLPQVLNADGRGKPQSPQSLAEMVERVRAIRRARDLPVDAYDVVIEADSYRGFVQLEPDDPREWEGAGATWWVESWWDLPRDESSQQVVLDRLHRGPRRT